MFFGIRQHKMPPVSAALWRTLRGFQIYGANTGVGKTVVSTVLCKALSENEPVKVGFLKPVSTGPLEEADDLCVCAEQHV